MAVMVVWLGGLVRLVGVVGVCGKSGCWDDGGCVRSVFGAPFLVFPFCGPSEKCALALRPVPCATGARRVRVCVALPAAVPLDAIHGVVRIGS